MNPIELVYNLWQSGVETFITVFGLSIFIAFLAGMIFKGMVRGFFGWLWGIIVFVIVMVLMTAVLILLFIPEVLHGGGIVLG